MGHRLPTILGHAIEDVDKTLNEQWEEDKIVDLLKCIERMEVLMQDLTHQAELRPIIDDGAGDVALWNKEIAGYFLGKPNSDINLQRYRLLTMDLHSFRPNFPQCSLGVR